MPPPLTTSRSGDTKIPQTSTYVADRESGKSDMEDAQGLDAMAKDPDEDELEKLVFGDSSGFRDALKSHGRRSSDLQLTRIASEGQAGSHSDRDDEGLEELDDADIFFLDAGATDRPAALLESFDSENSTTGDAKPAWEDSDDEKLTVSLAKHSRLRKLRVSEAEDVVNGKEYTKRLRRQYERLYPTPPWALQSVVTKRRRSRSGSSDASSQDAMDTDSEEEPSAQPLLKLLQNISNLTKEDEPASKKRKLRAEVIDIQRSKDVGVTQPSSVDSLSFHPTYPLLLSSGPSATLYLHHVSSKPPTPNPLLTSLHIRRTPLHTSVFSSPTGSRVFASGRRRYMHIWDLDSGQITKVNPPTTHADEQKTMESLKPSPCGRWLGLIGSGRKGGGYINILDAHTLQWTSQVRIDSRGGVADFCWWGDGNGLVIAGKSGEISEWDAREGRIVARWMDEGAVGTTVLSLGGRSGNTQLGGDRWVAVGSSSGIVNIYDRRPWVGRNSSGGGSEDRKVKSTALTNPQPLSIPELPKPSRTLEHLTTPVSSAVFSPDGQILALSSRWKRDALRLVHLPSCTVFRNWPTSSTPLGRISALAFSPASTMLAVANEQGKIRLWDILG